MYCTSVLNVRNRVETELGGSDVQIKRNNDNVIDAGQSEDNYEKGKAERCVGE